MHIYITGHGKSGWNDFIANHEKLGLMFTPYDYNKKWIGSYALDNGAFSNFVNGTCFDCLSFFKLLEKFKNPDFVVIPDIVAGGKKSLEFSIYWRKYLPDNYKWYFAIQDGMTDLPESILEKINGIFIGGSIEWKLKNGEYWVNFAHQHGLKAHVGRIGTMRNLMWAKKINADSVDSSNFTQHKKNWNELLNFINYKHALLTEVIEN